MNGNRTWVISGVVTDKTQYKGDACYCQTCMNSARIRSGYPLDDNYNLIPEGE